ncbi:formylmethanofuran--tetrahydromethanopterin N-formyltransferase [Archaeoglobus veneficus]|uniref:Formylmethanofuran--tetrahydromethanopterin formyltransferase n=1 Tax=Archaeoglobus veneficus (strain DSM 11195 / SNP6) TaxID=693661 RepID=F2KML2_ARCVS|nr:formylmethanofuran--tetrahydromethanopterin N-formyltransferase [Archaeoglobus veneficus]AEA47209.1 formylmethanofuran/tetrahydromethanopterin N-formyltransferase [Archaeoglobus veneficus SNP6]
MKLNGVEIEDTFAEAFDIYVARVLITAYDYGLAEVAATEATGFGTSIIMCPAEAGIEGKAKPEETPDGRPGVYIQICHPSKKTLEQQLIARIGQCILTAPTARAFDALPDAEERFDTGNKLRYFGDGFEKQLEIGDRKVWAIPIMEGDFIVENDFGVVQGVAGGNFFIMGENQPAALAAARAAVDAISSVKHVITPFPGGIVASGSKVGANKYKFLKATTNERFAPSLKGQVESDVPEGVNAIYEIVINGLSVEAVSEAMRAGIMAAVKVPGIVKITAGNYGGKLGRHAIYLKDLL